MPALYVCFDSLSARGNAQAGIRYVALFDLAAFMPIRWIPKGQESLMRPGIPFLDPDGTVTPANDALTRLLSVIPGIDSQERAHWRRDVLNAIGR